MGPEVSVVPSSGFFAYNKKKNSTRLLYRQTFLSFLYLRRSTEPGV